MTDELREMIAVPTKVHMDGAWQECPVIKEKMKAGQVHVVLKPQDKDWKNQHWYIYISDMPYSTMWKIIEKLCDLRLIDEVVGEDSVDIFKQIEGKTIKFTERRMGKAERMNWFPVSVVGEG